MSMFRHLGTTIRLLRELRGHSQAALARLAGMGKSQLSKYEQGKELPKLPSLEKILAVLGVTPLGFFLALYHLHETARGLEETEETRDGIFEFPDTGVLSESTSVAFGKVFRDLGNLYGQMLREVLAATATTVPKISAGTKLSTREVRLNE